MPDVGEFAPAFDLPDQNGAGISLASLRGKTVILFFYPKANTSGCTVEACGFRDAALEFNPNEQVVLGISPDPVKAQATFASKHSLPMPLLADADHAVAEAYGVWVEKSMYGRKYMGIERTTFVIDPGGRIAHVYRKVKPQGHAAEVLALLRNGGE